MNTITRTAVTTTAILMLAAPAAGAIPDTSEDAALTDVASMERLGELSAPLLAELQRSARDVDGDPHSEAGWEGLRPLASQGLTLTMTMKVRECSKAYWAMAYSIFGLYYMASSHALYGALDEALADLSTANGAAELLDSAYARAMRNCRSVAAAPDIASEVVVAGENGATIGGSAPSDMDGPLDAGTSSEPADEE